MGGSGQTLTGPDFAEGFAIAELRDGEPVLGHKDGEPVFLIQLDDRVRAFGASCTHYGGPLWEGLVGEGTVRCSWHHACFSLRTGEALSAPALNPLPEWAVEVRNGRVFLGLKREHAPLSSRRRRADGPNRVVIIGAGAAGSAAAEWLRREGYGGEVVLVDADPDAPYDRPNLSKDYLAGAAPEEWIPLRARGFYDENGITFMVGRAVAVERERRVIRLESGEPIPYDALLLATGAVPRKLESPGSALRHVHTLRSLADCRRIIAAADAARSAVVVGASFIWHGSSRLAAREGPGRNGRRARRGAVWEDPRSGSRCAAMARPRGQRCSLPTRHIIQQIDNQCVVLDDKTEIAADLVVVGVGVRPDTTLAESAGLSVNDGVPVDCYLRTADSRIYAAGDSARVADPQSGEPSRVEHWVVAQRQGQAAAKNILGRDEPYRDVPFFWTSMFGMAVSWVGHAAQYDSVTTESGRGPNDRAFRYMKGDRLVAVATISRDDLSLQIEREFAGQRAPPSQVR